MVSGLLCNCVDENRVEVAVVQLIDAKVYNGLDSKRKIERILQIKVTTKSVKQSQLDYEQKDNYSFQLRKVS